MSFISRVYYEGNLRTSNLHIRSGKSIITDAPIDNNGKGNAFSPTDLVATAAANCMLTVMGIYAQKNDINLDGISAEVEKIMTSNPRRIAKIKITVTFPDIDLSDEQYKKLEQIGINCPVMLSLSETMEKEIIFNLE